MTRLRCFRMSPNSSSNVTGVLPFVRLFCLSVGFTVLHVAAEKGNLEIVQYLVEHGADVKAKNTYETTVLHYGAGSGNMKLVQWLVKQGADVKAKDKNDFSI